MAQPMDGATWTALIGGLGTLLGIVATKGFDFLKARRSEASGDRRSAMRDFGNLIDRLSKRLDACELRHDQCQEDVLKLTIEVAELRLKVDTPHVI